MSIGSPSATVFPVVHTPYDFYENLKMIESDIAVGAGLRITT
jgi:hypothetical protein